MRCRGVDLVDPFGRIDPRPADLGHRPLQLPLHVLHARGGHDSGCPRSEVLTFEEIERLARVFVERFGVDGDPPHRWRADRAGPPRRCSSQLPAAAADCAAARRRRARPGDDHQRGHAAPARRTSCARAGLRPGQHQPRLAATATASPRMTRRDELDRVLDGIDAAKEAGFDPVKINAVVAARRQRRRDRRPRRRSAASAASRCASSSSCRSTPPAHWTDAAVVGQDEIVAAHRRRVPARAGAGPGAAPADRWRYLDGGGTVGVIPTRDASRSAATATGCGSPPTASSAPACSPPTSSTCGRRCARGADDDELAARDRAGRGHEVGRPPDQPGRLRPPGALDEPDRRLTWPPGAMGRQARRHARLVAMSDLSFTHLDPLGRARMVDVTPKEPTHRRAVARCKVFMQPGDHGGDRQPGGQEGRRAGRGPGRRHPGGQAHRPT